MSTEKVQYVIELNDKLTPGLKKAIASAAGLDTKMGGLNSKSKKASGGISMLAGSFGKLVPAIALAAAGMKAFSLASDSVEQARNFETLENAITFASGSAEEGAKNMKFLKDTTKEMGTPLLASIEGFKTLSGSMMGTKLAGKGTRDIFRQVSTASTAMGLGAEDSKGVFLALGQIMGKGKVQAEELRGQIGERIPGAFKIAADAMGVTQAELNKMMETGKLGAEEFLPRFGAQLEKVFKGALPKAINSSQAKLNRFNNLWLEMKIKIGRVLLPTVNKLMEAFTRFYNFLARNKEFINKNLIEPLKGYFSMLKEGFRELSGAITGGMTDGMTAAEMFKLSIKGIGEAIKIITLIARPVFKVFAEFFRYISLQINKAIVSFQFFEASVVGMVTVLKEAFLGLKDIISGVFDSDSTAIKRGMDRMFNAALAGKKRALSIMNEDRILGGSAVITKRQAGNPFKKSNNWEAFAPSAKGGATGGGFAPFVPSAGGGKTGKKASTSIDGVKSGRPTHINIDIGKLVENLNINSTNLDDMTGKIKDQITAVLMSSVNNVNNIAG